MVALERAARQEAGLSNVSLETMVRMLKKQPQAFASADVVHREDDRGVPTPHVRLAGAVCRTASPQRARDLH